MSSRRFVTDPLFLLLAVAGCIGVGVLSWIIVPVTGYGELVLPVDVPSYVFPIVWTTLYSMLGVTLWMVHRSGGNREFYWLFLLQMVLNFLWVPLFFGMGWMLVAFLDALGMWGLVLLMAIRVWGVDRRVSYMMGVYLVWLSFAAYLNAGAYL